MHFKEYFKDWSRYISEDMLLNILAKIDRDRVAPDYKDIFKAFALTSVDNLKIVFLGQDPYPQKGVATGLAFANKNGEKLSPSLQILKDACIDYSVPHGIIEFDPTLESWAKQGVLLLNSALTTNVGEIGAHTMLWRPFIKDLLVKLSDYNPGLVYVLFGEQAQTFKPYINEDNNHILCIKHPAWYSRINKEMPSDTFAFINQLCKSQYNTTIKWYEEE